MSTTENEGGGRQRDEKGLRVFEVEPGGGRIGRGRASPILQRSGVAIQLNFGNAELSPRDWDQTTECGNMSSRGVGFAMQAGSASAQVSFHRHNLGFEDHDDIGHGRGRGRVSVKASKGKNFVPEEERQLTRSILAISQDPISGNQQKGNAFWERIYTHYDQFRPGGHRGARSLESKWGAIKHDVAKFIGNYNQVKRLNKSGAKESDTLRMSRELYRLKSQKNTEFAYEHCWELVKDFPPWADGVSTSRQSTPSKIAQVSSDHVIESSLELGTQKSVCAPYSTGEAITSPNFTVRPRGTKAAKEVQRSEKVGEKTTLVQAKAAEMMAEATLRKAASLEYHNMLLLFSAPMENLGTPEAHEFITLLREEELAKLRRRRADTAALELREQTDREAVQMADATRERAQAELLAREDEETLRQMRQVRD
ncbi:hypothetical protein M758_N026500 [Ceratodon purpureus]|nr:hypothetical protein M758_N026500 [Ceratodon purpureus]